MNSLCVIAPYRLNGTWVFDDPAAGLSREPFVSGADAILDTLTKDLPGAESEFRLTFSRDNFPGATAHFKRERAEFGGHWYSWDGEPREGWLCPALFRYFESAPPELHAQVASLA